MDRRDHYPIFIIEDRYGGTYSRGNWLAVSCADNRFKLESAKTRIEHIMEEGPHGGDTEAMSFWSDPPNWIAVGNSPNDALKNLLEASQ